MTVRRIGRLLPFLAGPYMLLAITGAPAGGAAGDAVPRPDLVEVTVAGTPLVVEPGGVIRVTDTVRNGGVAIAKESTTGYYLARAGASRPGGLLVGRRPVRALRPGSVSRASKKVRIPASTKAGRYRLIACADERRRIRESDEADNCRTSARPVKVIEPSGADRNPPTFAGLTAAVTCIPGPIGTKPTSYKLSWDPARDNVTPSSNIAYDVYQATSPGGEQFARATYTTSSGATRFSTPVLPNNQTYYFVVRARDRAGNREHNLIERRGDNICR